MRLLSITLIFLALAGCSSTDDIGDYTCVRAADQSRCTGVYDRLVVWSCTYNVVPPGCEKAQMGHMEGYDWLVCCDEGRYP